MTCLTVRNNGDYAGSLWSERASEREGNQWINRHLSIFKNQYSVKLGWREHLNIHREIFKNLTLILHFLPYILSLCLSQKRNLDIKLI